MMSCHQWLKLWLGSSIAEVNKCALWTSSVIKGYERAFNVVVGCFCVSLYPTSTFAAEKIYFVYSPLEFTISVSSLEKFAREGTVDSELAVYIKNAKPEVLAQLRKILNDRLNLGLVPVTQFLYSSFGEASLKFMGNLIQTEAHQNGFYALRSALILAAADSEGITLINVLKKLPMQSVQVNLKLVLKVARKFKDLDDKTQQAITLIARQFEAEVHTEQIISTEQILNLKQLGKWQWTQEVLYLEDRHRQRKLIISLYTPQRQGQISTLVISPGLGASRADFVELAQHLVSHGFAVAIIDHPGSNRQQVQALFTARAREVVETAEFIDRPLDVSYLLDELQQRNQKSIFGRSLNLQKVGVIGHSFGGYTAFALAGATFEPAILKQECASKEINLNVGNISLLLQCLVINFSPQSINQLRDLRVQTVVAINPVGSKIFGHLGMSQLQIPVMLIGGSKDAISPVLLEQICPFRWLTTPNKYLVLIEKGTHTYANPTFNHNGIFDAPQLASSDPALARRYLNIMTLAFAKTHLANESSYLQASLVRSISEFPLPLKLVRSLNKPQTDQTITKLCPRTPSVQNP